MGTPTTAAAMPSGTSMGGMDMGGMDMGGMDMGGGGSAHPCKISVWLSITWRGLN